VIVLPCGQSSFVWIDGNTYTSNNNTATHTIPGGSINGCDSIVTLNLTFRTIATGTDNVNHCGTSYTWIDNVEYYTNNNTATWTITGGAANGCDSIVTLNLTLHPIATGTDVIVLPCGQTSFQWIDGVTYTSNNSTATWTITGGAANGCDSIVTLNLTFRPIATGTDNVNRCGTSFTWIDGVTYTSNNSTATWTITGGAANGCDSIVTLNLTFTSFAYGTDVIVLPCGQTSFVWIDGNTYTSNNSTATWTITGGAANGCDSIVTLNLTFSSFATGNDVIVLPCGQTSFVWINGVTYTSNNSTATHTITGGAANGCDSIVTLNLTFRPIATGTDAQSICGASYTWIDGVTYTSNNSTATWTITGGAANGCDSIVTLNLTFRPIAYSTDVQSICGTSYTWINGVTYTSNNSTATHTITGGAANGCDSIVTLNLTLRPIAHGTDVVVLPCGQTSFVWIDGVTYTSNNSTATWTITGGAANGCDSIVTLNLTFRPFAVETNINVSNTTICYGQTATLTATSSITNPVFRWYTSQTATTALSVGATLVTGMLTSNTTYYVSVSGTNVCENEQGRRKAVTVTVEICETMNCSLLEDKTVDEDAPKAGFYTHSGSGWDAEIASIIAQPFDSVKYYINGTLTTTGATLHGAQFPVGLSEVMVVAYFSTNSTICNFTVYVERVCPLVSDPDGDGNTYPVTKLAGMCWTSNLKTTKYTDGTDVPWAKPYTSAQYPDGAQNTIDFGLLYTWYSAINDGSGRTTFVQGICPDGWRIPSAEELQLLTAFDANELRNTNFWLKPNNNNNLLKFDARGAGFYNNATHRFEDLYGYTAYWSSDTPENSDFTSICACIHYFCNQVEMVQIKKTEAISVRCVME